MAFWGIAVSARANPLVGSPDAAALDRGWQAVEKAKVAGTPTTREREYFAAIEIYYLDWQSVITGRECWLTKPRWNRSMALFG